MIEILIRVLFLLFSLFVGIRQDAGSPPPPIEATPPVSEGETFQSLTIIDEVDTIIRGTAPSQIELQVSGAQPDGCDYPVQVDQRRDGSDVFVDIYRNMPLAVMCPAMLLQYQAAIPLDGSFDSGTYTIHVNDQTVEINIP